MNARWNANTVLLAVFVLILIGAGIDYGRRVLGGTESADPEESPTAIRSSFLPDFKVGDPAPDFALPDSQNVTHKLSELVKGKTMLFFACGCKNCREVQQGLSTMNKNKRIKDMPEVITVTTAPPEAEKAWFRDTGLKQKMLYFSEGKTNSNVMSVYKGKPCPRIYLIDGERNVTYIGKSMGEAPGVQLISMEIGKELGVSGAPYGATGMPGSGAMKSTMPPVKPSPQADPTYPPYAQPEKNLPGGA